MCITLSRNILELREAEIPWHSQRDNLVEMVQVLANLTGSLAKFARDVALLMQPEIGEASEGNHEAAADRPPCRTSTTRLRAPR